MGLGDAVLVTGEQPLVVLAMDVSVDELRLHDDAVEILVLQREAQELSEAGALPPSIRSVQSLTASLWLRRNSWLMCSTSARSIASLEAK
ncbi:MAG: hypothetical protein U5L11_06355 [Arhodomonas sp.]|nr:hypothetical protein [Arhodomonas sp.]